MSGGGVTGLPQHGSAGSTAPEMPPLARRPMPSVQQSGDEVRMSDPIPFPDPTELVEVPEARPGRWGRPVGRCRRSPSRRCSPSTAAPG